MSIVTVNGYIVTIVHNVSTLFGRRGPSVILLFSVLSQDERQNNSLRSTLTVNIFPSKRALHGYDYVV